MTIAFAWSHVLLWVVVIFNTLLAVALLRQLSDVRNRAGNGQALGDNRLITGAAVPAIAIADGSAKSSLLRDQFGNAPGVLLFLSAECATCSNLTVQAGLLPEVIRRRLALICTGPAESCRRLAVGARVRVTHTPDPGLAETFGVRLYPTAILVDTQWRVVDFCFPRDMSDVTRWFEHETSRPESEANGSAYELSTL